MAITLGAIALPDGLRWSDEHAWSPVAQSVEYSLTGALIVEEATKQAGRPITLVGGIRFAWMAKAALEFLMAAMDAAPESGLTLTLHDSRAFTVLPRYGADGAVSAHPVPRVLDSGFADPGDEDWYYVDEIRLMEV